MDGAPDVSLTELCARLVAETGPGQITHDMRVRARDALIDSVGCVVAGATSPVAQALTRVAADGNAPGKALIWGTTDRMGVADAALINTTAGHALDFDDSLPVLRGHPSVPLFAVGLALATTRRASGRDVLDAYVIGVELAARLGRLLGGQHYRRGWHITATAGALTTAAMAGRLLGLDASTMRHAFGLAASDSSGMVRNFGTMAKSVQVGRAARAGLTAAQAAAEGITADNSILDGAGGFADLYAAEGGLTEAAEWAILNPGIFVKRWPCCYANHRALAGIFDLVAKNNIAPGDVRKIRVGFLPDADKALVHVAPKGGLEAKFSIEYCAAAAVIDGRVTLDSFTDAAVARSDVRDMMARVERFAMPGEGSFSGVHGWTDVEIVTQSGRFETTVRATPGSPDAPMTEADRRDKFFGCVEPLLGEAKAEAALATLYDFDNAPDAAAALTVAVEAQA